MTAEYRVDPFDPTSVAKLKEGHVMEFIRRTGALNLERIEIARRMNVRTLRLDILSRRFDHYFLYGASYGHLHRLLSTCIPIFEGIVGLFLLTCVRKDYTEECQEQSFAIHSMALFAAASMDCMHHRLEESRYDDHTQVSTPGTGDVDAGRQRAMDMYGDHLVNRAEDNGRYRQAGLFLCRLREIAADMRLAKLQVRAEKLEETLRRRQQERLGLPKEEEIEPE